MELNIRNITLHQNKEKSSFALYNTVSFLLDESLPSFERIAQDVILQESNIATRLVEHAIENDQQKLQRPHSLRSEELMRNAVSSPIWTEWSMLAGSGQ